MMWVTIWLLAAVAFCCWWAMLGGNHDSQVPALRGRADRTGLLRERFAMFVPVLCCGVEIYTSEAWNRYATAMELARATAMPVRGARQIAEWSEAEEAALKAWQEE